VQCTKISPELECQGQRSKVKFTGDKKTKKCGILFGSRTSGIVLWGAVLRQFDAGGKISACCLVLEFIKSRPSCRLTASRGYKSTHGPWVENSVSTVFCFTSRFQLPSVNMFVKSVRLNIGIHEINETHGIQ